MFQEMGILDLLPITISIVSIILAVISTIVAILNFLYTRRRTMVRGPDFVMHVLGVEYTYHGDPPQCRIMTFIQNIGDRMGYLVFQSHKILTSINGKTVELKSKTKFDWQAQADTQTPKTFHFLVPEEAKDWKGGKMVVEGFHSTHRGELKPFVWEKALKG